MQGEYRANGGEWLEPALRRLMLRARRAAHAADTALAASGGRADRSSHCGQALMKVFSEGLKRRRRATLAAMNQLFKVRGARASCQRIFLRTTMPPLLCEADISALTRTQLYFRLNSHHLCKPLIRARHSPHFLPFEVRTRAEQDRSVYRHSVRATRRQRETKAGLITPRRRRYSPMRRGAVLLRDLDNRTPLTAALGLESTTLDCGGSGMVAARLSQLPANCAPEADADVYAHVCEAAH